MNTEKNVEKNTENKMPTITYTSISYSGLIDLVSFAVDKCFGAVDKMYHKYLQDYAETFTMLLAFTDYEIEGKTNSEIFDEVMNIRNSDFWEVELLPAIDEVYTEFVEYLDDEILTRTRPLARFDSMLEQAKDLLTDFNKILRSVDVEKLKDADLSTLFAAANAIADVDKADNAEKQVEDKPDNVVWIDSLKDN